MDNGQANELFKEYEQMQKTIKNGTIFATVFFALLFVVALFFGGAEYDEIRDKRKNCYNLLLFERYEAFDRYCGKVTITESQRESLPQQSRP